MIYLEHHGNRIADLEILETDQPWFYCNFSPLEGYSEHEKFFKEFQEEYKRGEVSDFDCFFGKLVANGYELVLRDRKSTRFILLFEEEQVRLRGQFV